MIMRVLWAALLAGLLAGMVVSVVQAIKVTPLIYQAETFEVAASDAQDASEDHSHADGEHWAPEDGLQRFLFTGLANILTSIGFAFLLVAGFALSRREVDWQKGLLWGLGGFAAFALIPGIVLPPEVPGAAAAALETRQFYWISIAVVCSGGLSLFAFAKAALWRVIGAVVALAPVFIASPHGEGQGSVPPELAAHFVAASLGTAAIFWIVLGGLSGHFYKRFVA